MGQCDFKIVHAQNSVSVPDILIQYMMAKRIAASTDGCEISNVDLGYWGIFHPDLMVHEINTTRVHTLTGDTQAGYTFNQEDFLPVSHYRDLLQAEESAIGFGVNVLVIDLGYDNVKVARLPVNYYQYLISESGLSPVFIGNMTVCPYLAALRAAFSYASFVAPPDFFVHFETVRQSKNIALSPSIASWLAGWISEADRIFMPLCGELNPFENNKADIISLCDERFSFDLFPCFPPVELSKHRSLHIQFSKWWRPVSVEHLRKIRSDFPRFPDVKSKFLQYFDENYYLGLYPDVRNAVASNEFQSGKHHYSEHGFTERRKPFELDPVWYCTQNPTAAIEVGQGDFMDFHSHYVSIGAARGFRTNRTAA